MRNKNYDDEKAYHFGRHCLETPVKSIVCFELCWQFVSLLLHLHYSIIRESSGCDRKL